MSAAMAVGNNTFEESLGMLTAMTEITRSAAKGSRALVTVQGRLNQIVDESSDTGKALTAWYEEHGIAVKDAEGQIRSLYDVLTDVAKIWPDLTKNEQMYYLQQQAGTTQTQNLSALLQNFNAAITATETAIDSTGSAMRENEAYMDSIEAKTQQLKATFEDFANRVLSKEIVTGFLDAGNAMLQFADTDAGAAITRIVGVSTALTSVVGIIGTIIGNLSKLSSVLSGTGGIGGLAGLLTTPKTLLIIGGIAAGATALVEVIKAIDDAVEKNKWENLVDTMNESNQELDDTKQGYEDVKKKLDELNNTPYDGKQSELEAEREQLQKQIEAYEHLIELQQQEAVEAARKVVSKGSQITGAQVSGLIQNEFGDTLLQTWNGIIGLTEEQLNAVSKSYESVQEAQEAVFKAFREQIDQTTLNDYDTAVIAGNMATAYDIVQSAVQSLGITISETKQNTVDWAQTQGTELSNLANYSEDAITSSESAIEQVDNLVSSTKDYYNALKILSDNGENLDQWQLDFIDNWEYLNGVIDGTNDALNRQDDALNRQGDALDALTLSVKETAQSLIDQAGQIDTTTQAYRDLVAQEIMFGNNGLDITAKLAALRAYAAEIGATAVQLASLDAIGLGVTDVNTYAQGMGEESVGSSGWRKSRKDTNLPTVNDALEEFNKITQELANKNKDKPSSSGGGSSTKKSIDETAEYAEKKAEEAAQKAQQEAEQAAEEAAQKIKEQINDTFDALKEAEEKYWDEKIDALETQNKLLDRQAQLEEKLKALQEAKERRILLYKNGQYQYSEDIGAIADAQAAYDETWRRIYNEEQKEILNDLKDKALAIIEEYRDKALENGQLTQADISVLLNKYHELGNTTYETIAYGVENITELIASGMSAITGNTGSMVSSVSKAMGTTSNAISSMSRNMTTASNLLNQTFGNGLSSILGSISGGSSIGSGNTRPMRDYVNEHWGETTGKFRDLSVLYGGGTAWWIGQMSKYLEDPEKNANLAIGTKADGSTLTLKELYETDWTKRASSASSMAEIEDYIQREQAKFILAGGNKNDYDALQQIAQNAYRELYFRNPSAITGNNPMYAVDAALRYSGSDFNVWQGSYAGSGLFNNRNLQGYYTKSQWQIYQDMAKQASWSGAGGEAGRWAQNRINEINQQIRSETLNEIDRQIAENSRKWFDADEEERKRLHQLNEELREYRDEIGGNANGTLSWRGGLSVVGEKGPELRVLNKGDGIIPADITENLWKMGSNPIKYFNDVVKSTSNAFNISNIELPSVTNAKEFVSALKNYALQYSYKR